MIRFAVAFALDHPVGVGHFPGMPIVPGALLLDRVLDALSRHNAFVANIALEHAQPASTSGCAHGWQVRSAKFPAPVVPGQTIEVEAVPSASGVWRLRCCVGAQRVLIAEVLAADKLTGDA